MNTPQKQQTESKRGFTIIEVVLVLAIAGLIFLMVFIALPALQRGQRDAQRKSDLTRISVQITNYLSSTRGSVPTEGDFANFVTGYLNGAAGDDGSLHAGDEYRDPSTSEGYDIAFGGVPGEAGDVRYQNRTLCDGGSEDYVETTSASRDYTLLIKLENQSAPFCLDSKA
jgi:prepilin-type N-terminal cleavage/methylation domain-containing protein